MTNDDRTALTTSARLLLVLLAIMVVFFIPAARMLDDAYPGDHMGFTLMGVWLFWMVPGAVFLGIATLWIAQRTEAQSLSPRSFFALGCAAAIGLFLLSLLKYRGWFRMH